MTKDEQGAWWMRGYKTGTMKVVYAIRDILENSEQRISILTIMERLDNIEQEVLEINTQSKEK